MYVARLLLTLMSMDYCGRIMCQVTDKLKRYIFIEWAYDTKNALKWQ